MYVRKLNLRRPFFEFPVLYRSVTIWPQGAVPGKVPSYRYVPAMSIVSEKLRSTSIFARICFRGHKRNRKKTHKWKPQN